MPKRSPPFILRTLVVATALCVGSPAVLADSIVPDELLRPQGLQPNLIATVNGLVMKGKFDEALQQVHDAQKDEPSNVALIELEGAVNLAKKDLAKARANYLRALAMTETPRKAKAMFGLASVAAASGNDAEFLSWLEKAAKDDPALPQPKVELVRYHLAHRDVAKALVVAQDLANTYPDSVLALDTLGSAQLASGQNEAAVRTYTKLASLRPDDAQSHYRRAVALDAAGDYGRASGVLKRALEAKPDFLEAKILLSSVELRAGHLAEAQRIAKEIQTAEPKLGSGWQLEGDVQMAQKNYPAAQQAYLKALSMGQTGLLVVKYSRSLAAGGKAREASALGERWLAEHPADVGVRLWVAASYGAQGRHREAIAQYERVVQEDRLNADAFNDLAWLYEQQKDRRALPTAEQAWKLKPDSAQIADTLGWILVEQGETQRGVDLLSQAARLAPNDNGIRYHLGAGYARLGNNDRAREELKNALAKDTKFPARADAEALLAKLPR